MAGDFDETAHFREGMQRRLDDAIGKLRARFVPKWQPIETAPRDEEQIIVVHSEISGDAAVVGFDGLRYFVLSTTTVFDDATHWMPLPELPND